MESQESIQSISSGVSCAPADLPSRAMPLFTCQRAVKTDTESEFSSYLHLNQLAVQSIKTFFPADHEIVVVVVAGPSGSGKSTWLNALAMHLDPGLIEPPFESGDSQLGVTHGFLVYPKPLSIGEKKSLLLCDMEGMDGLREDLDRKETSQLVQRMFFLGISLASCMCVHSPMRVPGSLIEGLRDMYQVATEIRTSLDLELPSIQLLISDVNEVRDPNALKTVIRSHCNTSQEFIDALRIRARGRPCGSFFDTPSISQIRKTGYLESLTQFLQDCPQYTKLRPGAATPITTRELISSILILADLVNSKGYAEEYLGAVQKRLLKVLQAETQSRSKRFKASALELAKKKESSATIQQFEEEVKVLKVTAVQEFQDFIEQKIRKQHQTCGAALKAKRDFADSLTYAAELALYTERHERYVADQKRQLGESKSIISCDSKSSNSSFLSSFSNYSLRSEEPSFSQHYSQDPDRFELITSMLDPSINRSTLKYSIPQASLSPFSGPLKKDGTPDMRYRVNREAAGNTIRMQVSRGPARYDYDIPLKKDGTPDMRYSINKQLFGGRRRRY